MRRPHSLRDWTRGARLALLAVMLLGAAGCADQTTRVSIPGGPAVALPRFDHIVVVIEENHGYDQIAGASDAPYINSLAGQGAAFTHSYAITHPSQPNYLALFAGSTFGITSDDCPQTLSGPDLGGVAAARGLSFVGYSEALPAVGDTTCAAGSGGAPPYARKHAPWVNFADVSAQSNRPFSDFPTDLTKLPAIAFVAPDQYHDMHSASVAAGDDWLRQHIGPYADWASTHNSLLILTWDEDDSQGENHILTLFVGAHVRPGRYDETIDHYATLRTIEALTSLPYTGAAADAHTIADIWQP